MKFGWINVFGAAIVILMLLPNILYATKNRDEKNLCKNKLMNVIEQAGRYSCRFSYGNSALIQSLK